MFPNLSQLQVEAASLSREEKQSIYSHFEVYFLSSTRRAIYHDLVSDLIEDSKISVSTFCFFLNKISEDC